MLAFFQAWSARGLWLVLRTTTIRAHRIVLAGQVLAVVSVTGPTAMFVALLRHPSILNLHLSG